jgi:hypothetical protein
MTIAKKDGVAVGAGGVVAVGRTFPSTVGPVGAGAGATVVTGGVDAGGGGGTDTISSGIWI